MPKTILKFELEARHASELVTMPAGSQIISAAFQNGRIVMWALVDPDKPRVTRQVWVLWTGWDTDLPANAQFIGTVQMGNPPAGPLVWHIFASGVEGVA